MTKNHLRKIFKERRLGLSVKERLKLDDLLLIQFQRLSFEDVTVVMNYWPIEHRAEMNTHLCCRYLEYLIPGLQVCYPVVNMDTKEMTAILVNDATEYNMNAYGIAEPVNGQVILPDEIDMVFVPLLSFDKLGYRVGYGKGFYDRFLKKCRQDVITVGFSYFEAVDKIEDTNQFDVPLNYCITPQKLYEF